MLGYEHNMCILVHIGEQRLHSCACLVTADVIHSSFASSPLTNLQMVFADMGEILSGGNFHGEYPAKVCIATVHCSCCTSRLVASNVGQYAFPASVTWQL